MRILNIFIVVLAFAISAIAQNATISGKVTYGNEIPLQGANVQIVQTRQSVRTDTNGNFSLSNVPPGRYSILVHLEGFSDVARKIA
ncbi:MAG TPA: hypothetical protein DEP46_05920, partial [Blastocatellia bacterium]|nr:hypothetical protein [Blastocatellia bacterium]